MDGDTGPVGPADTIVGISFDDVFRSQEFLTAAYRLTSKHDVELLDAVIIRKDDEGKTHVRETIDPTPARSALTTGMWSGLFGLILAGPIGWLAGTAVGAGAGAVRAKIIDLGIPDEWVAWFRDAVPPGSFTVVLLIGAMNREVVLDELQRFAGGHLVYANVEPDIVQRIRDALDDPSTGPLTQAPRDDQRTTARGEGDEPLAPPSGHPASMAPPDENGRPT